MFLELIATVFAGLAMAGVVMLVNRTSGGRLPRWTAPVAAGLAMITATVSNSKSGNPFRSKSRMESFGDNP